MKCGLTLAAVAAAGCSGSPTAEEDALGSRAEAVTAEPGDEVVLAVGAGVRYEAPGLTVTYRRLVGDSRCPLEAVCVWEGDAEVLLEVDGGTAPAETFTLHTTANAGPRARTLGSWRLELVRVDPYPSVNVEPDPAATRAVLRLVPGGG